MSPDLHPALAASLILAANTLEINPEKSQYEGVSFHWAPKLWNIMSPTPFIATSLILPTKLIICRENPAKRPSFAKNPPKNTTAYSSTEPLQVALWTFMLIRLGLNNENSLHILPLQSPHLLSSISNPSLYKPSVSSPWSVWLLKHKE